MVLDVLRAAVSMKRGRTIVAGGLVAAFVLFFFLVPVVPMNIVPCFNGGDGYASLSYRLFYVGMTTTNGDFGWVAHNYSGCK